jgi:hypothetical protein
MDPASASLTASGGNGGMYLARLPELVQERVERRPVRARTGPTPPRPLAPWQPRQPLVM